MSRNLQELPENLPVPQDDGACNHLVGMNIPSIVLRGTSGKLFDLQKPPESGRKLVVVFAYPRTGRPSQPPPVADWDLIPGARGCTPQTCAFRDHYKAITDLGADVFGLSTQTTEYQAEAVQRLNVPFDLLSDADLTFTKALNLPTFTVPSPSVPEPLIKRLAFVVEYPSAQIIKVFYPVFPPQKNAEEVIAWLKSYRKAML